MSGSKEIKRRISSIKGTQKMTRAMEMISAVKMRKAVEHVLSIRPYAHAAWGVLMNLSRAFGESPHPLLEVRPVNRVLLIVAASDRGLCGAFNAQVFKKLVQTLEHPKELRINRKDGKNLSAESEENLQVDIVTIGKKADAMARKLKREIVASFPNIGYFPSLADIGPITQIAIEEYESGKYDKVAIIYTDYVSAMLQQTRIRQLLPISPIEIEKQIAEMDVLGDEFGLEKKHYEYKIEPSPEKVLSTMLPQLLKMQIYHTLLESSASQEAARMVAMKNASDSAGEIAEDLTLTYNQIRQSKITQEIAEISAGRAVLE